MQTFDGQTTAFVDGLDAAIDAHMDWTRRVLRCAVLHSSPGGDVLHAESHTLCRFGQWFVQERVFFDALNPDIARRIDCTHQSMHDAIRSICERALAGVSGKEQDLNAFEASQADLLGLLAQTKTLVLTTAARHDPLTGLPMRYGIEQEFELCRKDAKRRGEELLIIMIDIDHFKTVNDTYGHPVGDAVLQQFAAALKTTVRENEPLYRFGGEEFLVLMRCNDPRCPELALQRVIHTIRKTQIKIDTGFTLNLTATLGVAKVGDQEDLTSAVKRADAALYLGKRAGRDRFILASDLAP